MEQHSQIPRSAGFIVHRCERRASTPTRPARPPKWRTQNYAVNLGRNPVVRKTSALLVSVIVFVVGQSQERRICGHTNVRITRLSLAIGAASQIPRSAGFFGLFTDRCERRASTPTRLARPPKRTQNYDAVNLGRNPVVHKTGALLPSVIVFVVGQSQERRICGHTNVRITRLSLGIIVAPAARNLKFPVKFPVSRELCAAYSRRGMRGICRRSPQAPHRLKLVHSVTVSCAAWRARK